MFVKSTAIRQTDQTFDDSVSGVGWLISRIVSLEAARHPLPDLALARRLGRDAHRSRLLGRLRRAAHRRGRRARRPRAHVHERPRHRGVRRRRSARSSRSSSAGRSRGSPATCAAFWRSLVSDSQLRWLGPEKGVIHLATAAVVNAVWDLLGQERGASRSGSCSSTLSPEELVGCDRLPLHRGRARRRRRRSTSCATRGRRRRAREREIARAAAIRRTRPRPAGSATTTTKVEALVARGASPTGFTPREDEGRRRPRVRRPPRRADPRRARAATAS